MIRRKLAGYLAALLLVGLIQACGGGGGGSDDPVVPPSNIVDVSAAGSDNAAGADKTYVFTSTNYIYTINNFADGDKLSFPAGGEKASVLNESFTDGKAIVTKAVNGNSIAIEINGLSNADDAQLYSIEQFAVVFGAGTVTNP